ncbi:MAG: hypothetical protein EKK61_02680 [Rickettsiales bacterium]|nr:MAG: hypothetical protein EKK61_02680 [Rickettsiales bacterium]
MLDKLVVHLKNIIFFKAIIYILIIIILSISIPIIKNDLNISFIKKQKATVYLQDVALKLESITDFNGKIIEINKYFNSLVNENRDPGCTFRIKFVDDIKKLGAKYELFEPIKIKSSRIYSADMNLTSTNHLEISYYTVDIHLKVSDYSQYLMITNDLYSLMPLGSVILTANIREIEGLSPTTVENLNLKKAPDNIELTITVLLRNVVYKY